MANISSKSSIDVLLSMKPSEFESLTRRELAPIVSRLNDMARKRIQRIEASGELSPAVSYIQRTGGILPIRGMELSDVRNQYLRVRGFLTAASGTVAGARETSAKQAKKIAEKVNEATGNEGEVTKQAVEQTLTPEQRGQLWELIDRAAKDGLAHVRLNYQKYVEKAAQAVALNEGKSFEEVFEDFKEKLDEESKAESAEGGGTISSMFPLKGRNE